jgi:hypothetical protein
MPITDQQKELLVQYKDKAFISAILAEESNNYFTFIKNLINIPLIVTNSAMVIINAIIVDQELLKILNIILNSSTGLILSLISNFKIYENIQLFHQVKGKFNKLSHVIDNKLTNDSDNITAEFITNIIEDYDQIYDGMEYTFPPTIKKRIKKQYEGRLTLPVALSVDIVEMCPKPSICCAADKTSTPALTPANTPLITATTENKNLDKNYVSLSISSSNV